MSDPLRFAEIRTHERRLPHWEIPNAIYFLTFRLADSLPQSLIRDWKEEMSAKTLSSTKPGRERAKGLERALDEGIGECHLARPEITELTAETLQHFDPKRYRLLAWCVMPNHVHVVVQLRGDQDLAKTVYSWKTFIARRANAMLGRTGRIWQREYFDRIIRDAEHLGRAVRYVRDNPTKAGLKDWPWVWVREDLRDW